MTRIKQISFPNFPIDTNGVLLSVIPKSPGSIITFLPGLAFGTDQLYGENLVEYCLLWPFLSLIPRCLFHFPSL